MKEILSFDLLLQNNSQLTRDITGKISNDTIVFTLKKGEDISNITPSIKYNGANISPSISAKQNFSNPVKYVVTAEDGSIKTYTTAIYNLSNEKKITAFTLKTQFNSALDNDFSASIIGDSAIYLTLPTNIDLTSLVPSIDFVGSGGIYPANQATVNFNNPGKYIVTAEDGTSKIYTVYISSIADVFANSNDGFLYDLNPVSGSVKWKYNVGGTGNCVYGNSTVYFFEDNDHSFSGNLVNVTAINRADGSLKWRVSIPNIGFISHYASLPLIKDDKLFLLVSGDNRNNAICIDAKLGSIVWSNYTFQYGPNCNGITIENNVLCIKNCGSGVTTLSANDGSLLATYRADLGWANPILLNSIVYYGAEGFYAKNLTTTRDLWYTPILPRSITMLNNVLYAVGSNFIYSINPATGGTNWSKPNIHNGGNSNSFQDYYSILGSNGKLFTLDYVYYLSSYNAIDGTLNWSIGGYITNPVVCNNSIFISDANSILTCLDAVSGIVKWKFNTSVKFSQSVVAVDYYGNGYYISESGMQN